MWVPRTGDELCKQYSSRSPRTSELVAWISARTRWGRSLTGKCRWSLLRASFLVAHCR